MAMDRLLIFGLLFAHFEPKIKPFGRRLFSVLAADFYQNQLYQFMIAELLRRGLRGAFISEDYETMDKNSKDTRRSGVFLRESDPVGHRKLLQPGR